MVEMGDVLINKRGEIEIVGAILCKENMVLLYDFTSNLQVKSYHYYDVKNMENFIPYTSLNKEHEKIVSTIIGFNTIKRDTKKYHDVPSTYNEQVNVTPHIINDYLSEFNKEHNFIKFLYSFDDMKKDKLYY